MLPLGRAPGNPCGIPGIPGEQLAQPLSPPRRRAEGDARRGCRRRRRAGARACANTTRARADPSDAEGPFYPKTLPADRDADLTRVAGRAGRAGSAALFSPAACWRRDGRADGRHGGRAVAMRRLAGTTMPATTASRATTKFQGYGAATTDAGGRYASRRSGRSPIQAGPAPARAAHAGRRTRLTTQIYVTGDAVGATSCRRHRPGGRSPAVDDARAGRGTRARGARGNLRFRRLRGPRPGRRGQCTVALDRKRSGARTQPKDALAERLGPVDLVAASTRPRCRRAWLRARRRRPRCPRPGTRRYSVSNITPSTRTKSASCIASARLITWNLLPSRQPLRVTRARSGPPDTCGQSAAVQPPAAREVAHGHGRCDAGHRERRGVGPRPGAHRGFAGRRRGRLTRRPRSRTKLRQRERRPVHVAVVVLQRRRCRARRCGGRFPRAEALRGSSETEAHAIIHRPP